MGPVPRRERDQSIAEAGVLEPALCSRTLCVQTEHCCGSPCRQTRCRRPQSLQVTGHQARCSLLSRVGRGEWLQVSRRAWVPGRRASTATAWPVERRVRALRAGIPGLGGPLVPRGGFVGVSALIQDLGHEQLSSQVPVVGQGSQATASSTRAALSITLAAHPTGAAEPEHTALRGEPPLARAVPRSSDTLRMSGRSGSAVRRTGGARSLEPALPV